MKMLIENNGKILEEITLTPLQEKSLILLDDNFLVYKINRILEFAVEQARQLYIKEKSNDITEAELITLADEIEARKTIKEEEEVKDV